MENSITKERNESRIIVEKVSEHKYKDDVMSAQLRQVHSTKTTYPGKNVGNDKQDSLFEAEAFGGESKVYETTQNRVTWIDVPLGSTVESVQAKVDSLGDNARIYQIVSTDVMDCLTSGHLYQITQGTMTLADQQESKALRNSDGELVRDESGNILYRALYFSTKGQADLNHNLDSESIEVEASSDEDVA